MDNEVTNKKGARTYVPTGEEKYLSLRTFTAAQKREAYERQGSICLDCQAAGKAKLHYKFNEMAADHIRLGVGVARPFWRIAKCDAGSVIGKRVIYSFALEIKQVLPIKENIYEASQQY